MTLCNEILWWLFNSQYTHYLIVVLSSFYYKLRMTMIHLFLITSNVIKEFGGLDPYNGELK